MSKIHLLDSNVWDNQVKIYDLKFNPLSNQIGLVDIAGKYKVLQVNQDDDSLKLIQKINISDESIFTFDFWEEYSSFGISNGEVLVLKEKKVLLKEKTNASISKVKFLDQDLVACGNGEGLVKVFDIRAKKEVFKFKEQEEDITDIEYKEDTKFMLNTSIDGTLAVYDLRKDSLYALSDCIEDELNCMKLIKHKVACGTSEGPIVLFNWDWFGDYKDRIMGHPASVTCMEKFNDNVLVTGCEDGGIRFVSMSPKSINSIVSDKQIRNFQNKNFNEINALTLSGDNKYLAVCSNIQYVKLYNIKDINFDNIKGEDNNSEDIEDSEVSDDREGEYEENEENESNSLSNDEELQDEQSENFKEEADNDTEHPKDNDNSQAFDEEDYDDSSESSMKKKKKKNKTDKSLSLGKKRKSEYIIDKERRKDFFNDL